MPRQRKKGIKGNGSVFQRKDGRWVAQFLVEETGKTKQIYAPTEKEANEKLKQALQEQKQGILATGPQQKLGDFLNWWLEESHKNKIRKGSYVLYKSIINNHLIPALGQVQLRKLSTKQIQEFYNRKINEECQNQSKERLEGRKSKKKLSSSYIHSMHMILHGALKSAVKWRYIPYNPADGISLPPAETERDIEPLSLNQARILLRETREHRLGAFIALALTTGMRHGELAALRWDDINFEEGAIRIQRTVAYHYPYKIVEGAPKTKKSERVVPLVKSVHSILLAHRERQDQIKSKAGTKWQEHNLVFCNIKGGFLLSETTRVSFYALLKKIGLPQVRIHDLRHTASTLWQHMGISLKVAQEMLGHSDIETTANTYSHVLPEMRKEVSETINLLFQDPN